MPVDRTWFNSLVDDDGSNTVGTLWNKAAVDGLLDSVDAELVDTVPALRTDIGTVHNWAPGLQGHTTTRWAAAGDLQVTGLAGGVAGQQWVFCNTGSTIAYFAHLNSGSVTANQLRNLVTSAATPVAPGGWVAYLYDGTAWLMIAHQQGAWITPAFSAADFTGSGSMAWTVEAGDVVAMRFVVAGRSLTVAWYIGGTTLSGTASSSINISNGQWGGFQSAAKDALLGIITQDAGFAAGFAQVGPSSNVTKISLWKMSGSWALGTNTIGTYGTLTFEVL